MFKKRRNKEILVYHVLIKNFIRHQAFTVLLQENQAQAKDILM